MKNERQCSPSCRSSLIVMPHFGTVEGLRRYPATEAVNDLMTGGERFEGAICAPYSSGAHDDQQWSIISNDLSPMMLSV